MVSRCRARSPRATRGLAEAASAAQHRSETLRVPEMDRLEYIAELRRVDLRCADSHATTVPGRVFNPKRSRPTRRIVGLRWCWLRVVPMAGFEKRSSTATAVSDEHGDR
jgi:hypothetical protein